MHDLEEYLSVLETISDRTVEFEKVTQEQSVMVACAFFGFVKKVFPTLKPKLTSLISRDNDPKEMWKLNDSGKLRFTCTGELVLSHSWWHNSITKTSDISQTDQYIVASCEEALPEIASALPYLLNLNREIVQVRQETTIKAISEIEEVCAKALKEMRKLPIEEVS